MEEIQWHLSKITTTKVIIVLVVLYVVVFTIKILGDKFKNSGNNAGASRCPGCGSHGSLVGTGHDEQVHTVPRIRYIPKPRNPFNLNPTFFETDLATDTTPYTFKTHSYTNKYACQGCGCKWNG